MPIRFMFVKSQRLKSSADFTRVYNKGVQQADQSLVVNVLPNDLLYCRIGLSVSRQVGGAVMRNRWKRAIRESFRLQQHTLPTGFDIVVRPRRGAIFCRNSIAGSLCSLVTKAAEIAARNNESL